MTKKERKKLYLARRLSSGKCAHCKSPVAPGKTCCQRHLDILKTNHAIRLKNRDLLGLCVKCGGAVSKGRYCDRHHLMRRAIRSARKLTAVGRVERSIKKRLRAVTRHTAPIPFKELVGCSSRELVTHLESLWKPGMDWSNYGWGAGKWQLDHIRPICSFDRTSREGLKEAFHFSNTQPLWHEENMAKATSLPEESSGDLSMRSCLV